MSVHVPAILMSTRRLFRLILVIGMAMLYRAGDLSATDWKDDTGLRFVERYCIGCHEGAEAEAALDLAPFDAPEKIAADRMLWRKLLRRVRQHEMPPEDSEQPTAAEREAFVQWIEETLRAARQDGIAPGPANSRRLNRTEYAATIRDLLGIHVNAAQALPSDGAGGEGFDNAAETLFISPIHAEKYLDAARTALSHAFSDPRSQRQFMTAEVDDQARRGIRPVESLLSFCLEHSAVAPTTRK